MGTKDFKILNFIVAKWVTYFALKKEQFTFLSQTKAI